LRGLSRFGGGFMLKRATGAQLDQALDGLEHALMGRRPAREELVGGLAFRVGRGARVERVDLVVQLGVLAIREHARDTRWHRLFPRGQVREVVVEGPTGREPLDEALARKRLERGPQPAVALPDPPQEQRLLRSSRDRGRRHRPP
jgi:hypothetical protein